MKDVAALASVSLWTVSNYFSHPDRVASSTRERVLSAAAALGYAGPDPLARSLAPGRTGVVALVAAGAAERSAALVARGRRPAGRTQEERAAPPVRGDGVEAGRVVASRMPRATAILALGGALGGGALEAVRWMGLSVPEDISIAGIDNLPESAGLHLTSVLVPYRPMGELAGAVLATLMEHGEVGSSRTT